MSSPYGSIDPNRIALNKAAREAQQQAQAQEQARQAELDRRLAIEAQKAEEKRLADIRAANERVANDPLAQRGRFEADVKDALKTGRTIKTLQEMGYDVDSISFSGSKNAPTRIQGFKNVFVESPKPSIDYAAETAQDFALFKQVEKQNPNLIGLNISRNYGPGSNPSQVPLETQVLASYQSREQKPRYDVSESDVIGRLAGGAKAAGTGTEFGYSISKDKAGNVTDVEQSLFFTPGVKVSGEALSRNYEVFKQKQIESANFGPTAYVRNFPIKYDVSLADSLSGRPVDSKGNLQPTAYNVNISDTVGLSDKITPLPSSPITGFVWSAQNQLEDLSLGAFGSGVGIGSIFTGLAGKPLNKGTQQLIESRGQAVISSERPELLKGLIDAGAQQIGGKSDGFGGFAGTLSTAPLFFAGSAGFTALTFATPGGIGKGVTSVARGLGFLAREAPRAASELSTVLEARTITSISELPYGGKLLQSADRAAGKLVSGFETISENVAKAKAPLNVGFTELKYGKAVSSRIGQVQQTADIYGSIGKDVVQTGFSKLESAVPRSITQSRTVGEFSLLPARVTAGLRYDVPEAISSFPLTRAAQNLPDAFSEFYSGTSRTLAQGLRSVDTRARLAAFDVYNPVVQGIAARKGEAEFLAYIARERVNQALPSLDPYAVFNLANRASRPLQPIGQAFDAFSLYASRGAVRTGREVRSLFDETLQDFGDLREQFNYDFSTKIAQPVKNQLQAEYDAAIGLGKFLGSPVKGQLAAEYSEAVELGKFIGRPFGKAVRADITSYNINKFNIEARKAQRGRPDNVFSRGFFAEGTSRKSNVQPKTSFSPLENIGMQLVDKELKGAAKSTASRAIDADLGKFLGVSAAAASKGGSLGFGGATGAEKSRRTSSTVSEDSFLRYPVDTGIKQPTRSNQRESIDDLLNFRVGERVRPTMGAFNLLGMAENSSLRGQTRERPQFAPLSLFDLQPKKGIIQSPDSLLTPLSGSSEESALTPLQAASEALSQRTIQRTEEVPPRTPPELLFFFAGDEERGGRKRKGRRKRYGELVFKPSEIFSGTYLQKLFPIE